MPTCSWILKALTCVDDLPVWAGAKAALELIKSRIEGVSLLEQIYEKKGARRQILPTIFLLDVLMNKRSIVSIRSCAVLMFKILHIFDLKSMSYGPFLCQKMRLSLGLINRYNFPTSYLRRCNKRGDNSGLHGDSV